MLPPCVNAKNISTCLMYLKLDFLPSEFNSLDFEVDPDGRNEGRVEGIVGEPEEDAGLADTRVTDEQQLEEEIVTFFRHFFAKFI